MGMVVAQYRGLEIECQGPAMEIELERRERERKGKLEQG
jgi:hypothetical protein